DDITGCQELRWIEPDTDADRGAGGDDVAGFEGDAGADGFDNGGDVEDQIGSVGLLAGFAVDGAQQIEGLIADLVAGHGPRAHGAVGVQALAEEPLGVFFLHVPGGDVVDVGVSPDVVHRLVLGDVAPTGADDDAGLRFVVQPVSQLQVGVDVCLGADDSRGGFGEDHRVVGDVAGAGGGVEAGVGELLGVLEVVATDAEDVAT